MSDEETKRPKWPARRRRPAPPPDVSQLQEWLSKLSVAVDDASRRAAPATISEPLRAAKTFLTAVIAAGTKAREQFGPMAFEQAISNGKSSLAQLQAWQP